MVELTTVLFGGGFDVLWMAVWTLHGVPAATALGVTQKPARKQRVAGVNP